MKIHVELAGRPRYLDVCRGGGGGGGEMERLCWS
jgi:hypothetical protein